jgi:hypothetical protein
MEMTRTGQGGEFESLGVRVATGGVCKLANPLTNALIQNIE